MTLRTGMLDCKSLAAVVTGTAVFAISHVRHLHGTGTAFLPFKDFFVAGLASVAGVQMFFMAEQNRTQFFRVFEKNGAPILLGEDFNAPSHKKNQHPGNQQKNSATELVTHIAPLYFR